MTATTLPISVIGPEPYASSGSMPVEQVTDKDKSKIEGEKVKPAPMIPPEIPMTDEAERRFANYLQHELYQCRSERAEFIRRLARYKEKYRTKFPEFPKDWPIANSSQITVPVIRTAVHTLTARIYQTIMAAEPLAAIRTKDSQFQDFAYDYEQFLGLYSDERLDMPEILDGWLTELIKLGTAVLEVTTKLDRRVMVNYDPTSGSYQKQAVDIYNGPIIYHVPLEDFWIRPAYKDPEVAPWCGKEVRLTWSQIKDMALSGEFDPEKIDRIWRYAGIMDMDTPETDLKQEEIEKLRPTDRNLYSIHELAVRWDTDGDGIDEELLVYFHEPSRTFLRKKYSGFRRRPWRAGRYIPIEHWFYGEGMCEILEHLQEEISTIHNQRIDNAAMANLQIILVSRLIQGLRPGDRLWTGKVVRVRNVKDDVGTLRLGEVYPSTVQNEVISQQYARELSGVGEVATGQAQPVTRTTATAQLALLEELNRRFDKVVKGIRRTLRGVYTDLTWTFLRTGTNGLAEEWLGPIKGRRLEEFLSMPSDYVRQRVKIQIQSTKATLNRETEFQSQIAVFGLLNQMSERIFQMAQMLTPQAIPLLAHELVKAYIPVFKKVMQYADAPDPDQAISVLTVLERILPAPEDMGGMAGARTDAAQAELESLANRVRAQLGATGATTGVEANGGVGRPMGRNGRNGGTGGRGVTSI